jgi:D-psicose/D-tagatose/L-ribulose 3-epimerase
MRLSISNIAWEQPEEEEIALILKDLGVDAVDIAPGRYFPDQSTATKKEITEVRELWCRRGCSIVGMQSLLFGVKGLNLFGSAQDRTSLTEHLRHSCRIAAGLGATRLVFGSPRNRDRTGLQDSEAEEIAFDFFSRLGNIALNEGVTICIEANPPSYGCNFILTTPEALEFVQKIQHPAIKLQLDTGTILTNGERLSDLLLPSSPLASCIGHIHISEPGLMPPGDSQSRLEDLLPLIRRHFPNEIATIEMLATREESHLASVERAIRWTTKYFTRQYCHP